MDLASENLEQVIISAARLQIIGLKNQHLLSGALRNQRSKKAGLGFRDSSHGTAPSGLHMIKKTGKRRRIQSTEDIGLHKGSFLLGIACAHGAVRALGKKCQRSLRGPFHG